MLSEMVWANGLRAFMRIIGWATSVKAELWAISDGLNFNSCSSVLKKKTVALQFNITPLIVELDVKIVIHLNIKDTL